MCIKCLNNTVVDYTCNFIEDLMAFKWQAGSDFSFIVFYDREREKDKNN